MEKFIRGWKKKELWVNIIGIILARAVIFSMNPVALAYFVAVYSENNARAFIFLGMLLGMATVMPGVDIIKYALVMLIVIIITALCEQNKKRIRLLTIVSVASIATVALGVTKALLYSDYHYYMMLAMLEGIIVWSASMLFQKGVHYFLHAKRGQTMDNEEMISIAVLLAALAYAMPAFPMGVFSLAPMAAYLFVLFMGYKYGAGSGAIAGAACGIIVSLGNQTLNMIAIMCILGICAGVFRESGKIGTAIAFIITQVCLCYLFEDMFLKVEQLRGVVSGAVVFLLLPKKFIARVSFAEKEEWQNYAKQNLQQMTRNRLREFSESFQKLSKTFYHIADMKTSLEPKDMDSVLEELSEKFCVQCTKCNFCWKHNYYNTFQAACSIIGSVNQKGAVLESEVPFNFSKNCINYKAFIEETKRSLELAKINLSWYNKMAESRQAIAGQLGEVANIIKDFAADIYETKETQGETEAQIKSKLRSIHIDTKKIAVIEKRGNKLEVFLSAKTKKGSCVSSKEAAVAMGDILGRKLKPSDSTKNIIPKDYEVLIFVEDTNFKTLTGIARMKKTGEEVCGDNFSFIELDSGEMIMTLSDGMGAGEEAHSESESVVELIEQFIEAGFRETSAIRLINSVLVLKSDKQSFSTVDMGVINLYTGICEFIKVGAAASFIKREGWVETICSTSMPAGIFNQVDIDGVVKKLYNGDFVVMMTDGVLDCFPGEYKEQYIEDILMATTSNNPKEIAHIILEQAMAQNFEIVSDDMTVMVAGIWQK